MALNHDVENNINGTYKGDPTEIAIVEYYISTHEKETMWSTRAKLDRVYEFPFDADRKCMTTIHQYNEQYLVVTKGAAETLSTCFLPQYNTSTITNNVDEYAVEGMRVIVYGFKIIDSLPIAPSLVSIESELHFAGITGMIDPPREEVKQAIHQCKTAGIHTVMITGDHPKTAASIAKQIGLLKQNEWVVK
jgi:Ca2+-transporting ATPase